MNPRIKELAEQQAGAILMDLVMPDSGMPERVKWNVGITSEHLEKFAELIVQECILTIQMGITRDGHNTEKYLRSVKHIKQIKEHFGVEE